MTNLIKTLAHLGTTLNYPRWKNRNIIVTNNLALLCGAAVLLLNVVHTLSHPGEIVVYVVLPINLIFFLIPFINKSGYINFSRTLLTFSLVLGTLAMTIVRKVDAMDPVSVSTFYQPRVAILFFSIISIATFNFKERGLLIFNLLISFLVLILFDPIHNALHVGFYQLGNSDPEYYYTNIIFLIIYLIVVGSVTSFKKTMDNYALENENLIASLNSKNILIVNQKDELENQGEILKQLLLEKDKDLSKVTHELIKFNQDLLQYSYTISHNLRGPIARILGLLNLMDKVDDQEKQACLDHILTATHSLDNIVHDLNTIIELRSDSFIIRENVIFEDLTNQVIALLAGPIGTYQIRVDKEFEVKEIFSAKSRLSHILFSVITNAIQFRREDTSPNVFIRTYRKGEEVVLEIKDNGCGMDLTFIGENLFKPFKRFNPWVSGKGIGLFLVKLQIERLHGRIEVMSTPGVGSTFMFYLKDWNEEVK